MKLTEIHMNPREGVREFDRKFHGMGPDLTVFQRMIVRRGRAQNHVAQAEKGKKDRRKEVKNDWQAVRGEVKRVRGILPGAIEPGNGFNGAWNRVRRATKKEDA